MQKLIDGLRHFQENLFWQRQELFERSVAGQKPQAMLITCSDSRVLPETLMQADPGDLFVARNAGNLVPSPATAGGEAATIDYAVATLGVTDLIVCGHYRCGAVKALLDSGAACSDSPVSAWLTHAAGTLDAMDKHHSHLEGQERWDKAVEQNVLVQLDNLAQHPAVMAGLAAGKLRLHAWVLRFESSEVLAYDPCLQTFEPLLEMPVVHAALPVDGPGHAPPTEGNEKPEPLVRAIEPAVPRWFETLRTDLPASLVVFAVALPLCVAIAKASSVPTAAGIITAIIGGVVVGLLGGGPLQVSGPTASLIMVLLNVTDQLGVQAIGIVVLLAGLLQIIGGFLRLGQWFRAVSPAVILGMLAGIGAVLLGQQLHLTVDDLPSRSPVANYVGLPQALFHSLDGHPGHPEHREAALIGLLTLSVLLGWKRFVPSRFAIVPPVLAAVSIATVAATFLDLPIQRVTFDSLATGIHIVEFSSVMSMLTNSTVWQMAFTVALLASAESLLTAAALDGMHTGQRTRYDRELAAQGVGNVVCGLLGALPLAGVIVRSSANLQAGAKSRWSAVFHGVWMLAFVLLAPGLLRLIPVSALAATLVLTGFRLIQFRSIQELWRESRSEGAICVAVAVTIITVDLLTGILLGIGLSIAKLIHTFSRLRIRHRRVDEGRMTLVLEGSATFLRLPKLASALEKIPPGIELSIDCKGLSYIDHTCLTLLMDWEKQFQAAGGHLVMDWETLRARFQAGHPRPRLGGRAA